MSRVGKTPILLPEGVTVNLEGSQIVVENKGNVLSLAKSDLVDVAQEDQSIVVKPKRDTGESRAMWGTYRMRIANMVEGLSKGYKKQLELVGVGYRAQMRGTNLVLSLGYSHEIVVDAPEGIKFTTPAQTSIVVEGYDKQVVGEIAAKIRSFRKPEPYKGKGVRYLGETVLMKEKK